MDTQWWVDVHHTWINDCSSYSDDEDYDDDDDDGDDNGDDNDDDHWENCDTIIHSVLG